MHRIAVRTGAGKLGDCRRCLLSFCSVSGTGLGADVRPSQTGEEDESLILGINQIVNRAAFKPMQLSRPWANGGVAAGRGPEQRFCISWDPSECPMTRSSCDRQTPPV